MNSIDIVFSLLNKFGYTNAVISSSFNNKEFRTKIDTSFKRVYEIFDDRSAAYFSVGLSEESCENVVIFSNGNVDQRNYAPGLTEAYYRKRAIVVVDIEREFDARVQHRIYPLDMFGFVKNVNESQYQSKAFDYIFDINICLMRAQLNGGQPILLSLKLDGSISYDCKDIPFLNLCKTDMTSLKISGAKKSLAFYFGPRKRNDFKTNEIVEKLKDENSVHLFADINSGLSLDVNIVRISEPIVTHYDIIINFGGCNSAIPFLDYDSVWTVTEDGNFEKVSPKLDRVFYTSFWSFLKTFINANQNELFNVSTVQFRSDKMVGPLSKCLSLFDEKTRFYVESAILSQYFDDFKNVAHNVFSNFGKKGRIGILSMTVGASLMYSNCSYVCFLSSYALLCELNTLGNRHIAGNLNVIVLSSKDSDCLIVAEAFAKSWFYNFNVLNDISQINNDFLHEKICNDVSKPSIIIINV